MYLLCTLYIATGDKINWMTKTTTCILLKTCKDEDHSYSSIFVPKSTHSTFFDFTKDDCTHVTTNEKVVLVRV